MGLEQELREQREQLRVLREQNDILRKALRSIEEMLDRLTAQRGLEIREVKRGQWNVKTEGPVREIVSLNGRTFVTLGDEAVTPSASTPRTRASRNRGKKG